MNTFPVTLVTSYSIIKELYSALVDIGDSGLIVDEEIVSQALEFMEGCKAVVSSELLVEIGDPLEKEWSREKLEGVKTFIKRESAKRTPEDRIRMELRGLRFEIEEYLEESSTEIKQVITSEAILKECVAILVITFRRFAGSIDMTDGNLKKYTTNGDLIQT